MTITYDLIAETVLQSSATTIDFQSIPNTYRDLVLVAVVTQHPNGAGNPAVRLNNDASSSYTYVQSDGTGSSFTSWTSVNSITTAIPFSGSTWSLTVGTGMFIMNIMDYSQTNKHKTVLTRSGNAAQGVGMNAARYASTGAINRITILDFANPSRTAGAGSTFYLYGIVS